MKKILSLVLAALMLFAIIPTTALAANTPVITATANKTTVAVGDVVTVTVSLSENSKLTAFQYDLLFNPSYFEVVSGSVKTYGAFSMEMTNDSTAGKVRFGAAASSPVTGAAKTFLTAQFKVVKTGGKITCNIVEAYVDSNGTDVDVTSACAAASTKSISFSSSSNPSTSDYIAIKTPSRSTIRCKDSIILHATTKKTLPSGATIKWTADNKNFKLKEQDGGNSCKITSESNGPSVITATLYSASGSVLEVETIEMTSKASFFDKLGGFFRNLFGTTKTYDAE